MNDKDLFKGVKEGSVEKAIDVWTFFIDCYGVCFIDDFGEAPNKTWLKAMNDLTIEEIECGKNNIIEFGLKKITGLPEFYAYCKGVIPNSEISKINDYQNKKIILAIAELERKIDKLIDGDKS